MSWIRQKFSGLFRRSEDAPTPEPKPTPAAPQKPAQSRRAPVKRAPRRGGKSSA